MNNEYSLNDILAFEQRFRATFINSLGGFKSLALIGTRSRQGNTNLAIFNSLFHIGANPPLFGFIIRPDSVDRHTLNNILETGEFTVNHVLESFYEKAHQTSARYPSDISEFDATNLTEEYKAGYYAPFVKESHIQISAHFTQKIDIQENSQLQVDAIGLKEVLMKLPEDQQFIVNQLYLKGYTQSEVAEEFNIPLGTVKTRLRLAMIELRSIMNIK